MKNFQFGPKKNFHRCIPQNIHTKPVMNCILQLEVILRDIHKNM